jgi:hypothetical protein
VHPVPLNVLTEQDDFAIIKSNFLQIYDEKAMQRKVCQTRFFRELVFAENR